MKTALSAGSTIETLCTRCNGVLNHTIVAMVGEKIVRVECSTCHGLHAYHPAKTPGESAGAKAAQRKLATPRKVKADSAAAAGIEWVALQSSIDPVQAVLYDMNRTYSVNTILSHQNFGLGIVQLVVPPNKIEVLFQAGRKRLRCG